MKKNYLKPEAEHIDFEAKDLIANNGPIDGEMGGDDDFWGDMSGIE